MHLVEISIFSLNNVTFRLTKIMNNLLEHLTILIFKVIFQCWKLIESFQICLSLKKIGLGDQLLIKMVFCYHNCSNVLWEKIVQIFPKNFFYEEYWTRRPTFIKNVFENFDFLDTGGSRLMRISLLRFFKTITKIWLMPFYGLFILLLRT